MHKHKSKHVPTPLSCRKTRIFIFMGTVNNILFPAHLSIMFRHNRTSRTFSISFSLTARPLYISRITTSLFEQNLILFRCVLLVSTPQMLNVKSTLLFQRLNAAVRLQTELPTRAFYGRLSFRGKHLFHVSVRKRIYIPSEHDARRHFRTLSTQILVHFISTISHQYASQQTVLFLLFSSHLPQISEVFTNYFQGHDDEVVSKDGARVTLLSAIVLFVGLEFI